MKGEPVGVGVVYHKQKLFHLHQCLSGSLVQPSQSVEIERDSGNLGSYVKTALYSQLVNLTSPFEKGGRIDIGRHQWHNQHSLCKPPKKWYMLEIQSY